MTTRILTYCIALLLFTASGKDDARKANEAYEKEDYARAEALYKTAIESEPENAEIYFNLGNALTKQGKTQEAIENFMQYRSLAETPEDKALADYNIGTVLAGTQQWKPAARHFKNSLRLNPDDNDARHNFERALAESQKQQQEQQQQQENQKQEPPSDYAKAMKKRAEQLVAERKYEEAFNLMQEALKVDQTVQNFNQFITRIGQVDEIDS